MARGVTEGSLMFLPRDIAADEPNHLDAALKHAVGRPVETDLRFLALLDKLALQERDRQQG